ncbi:GerAB/ArcD/ProY family transporter [Clostridium sporogenes]|uniref:GerAB/ArcD/ProY family transporter n=1 Tax=Clostridium sporogenes TaxID=1509 RepID=UPI003F92273A
MSRDDKNLLTSKEITFLLVGLMTGMGILSLPNDVVKLAKQDGWISAIIGSIYPIYIIFLSDFIIKRFPNENLLSLSRKILGNFFGNILNILFGLQFMIYATSVAAGFNNILRTYIVSFLSPFKIYIVVFLLAAYTSSKSLKTLGKVNNAVFYITILILAFSLQAIKVGSILNIKPVFGSGFTNIIKASKNTAFEYATVESLLLIHPFVKEKNKIKKSALKAVGISAVMYSWAVFITTFYLSADIIPKNIWSFLAVADSVKVPIINNFKYIFMFLWMQVIYKTKSNEYYLFTFIFNDITKFDRKKMCIFLYPIFIYLSLMYKNETLRRKFLNFIIPKVTIFNIAFVSIVALLIFLKKDETNENN